MTDLTRFNDSFQKKTVCILVAPIIEGTDQEQVVAADDNHLVALLPPNAYLTDAYVFVEVVSDAGTSAVALVGTVSGGSEILTAGDLQTLGKQGTFVPGVETKTGTDIWVNLTYTGTTPTNVGRYKVIVEYLEFTKDTGEYTRFTTGNP